ncbi:MAG: hypothetical protein ABI162_18640 [Luteolibacter sp.]
MKTHFNAAIAVVRSIAILLLGPGLASALSAQTLSSIGTATPSPGPNDISQLVTSSTTRPDGLNYYTDNGSPAGQTFTTGPSAMKLTSLSIKTAGLDSANGYGTPATTPTFYLRIYSISGSTATLLISFSAPNPGYRDGVWLKWSGLNVPLQANKTFTFSFGSKPTSGGWAAHPLRDTNLNSGTTYYYQVVAVNGSGSTGFSPEAHAKTTGVNPDPVQYHFVLSAPTPC